MTALTADAMARKKNHLTLYIFIGMGVGFFFVLFTFIPISFFFKVPIKKFLDSVKEPAVMAKWKGKFILNYKPPSI
jgi:hypothetical protein